MGPFYSDCRIASHGFREKWVEVPHLLVDTGSEFTWINGQTLARAGIAQESKSWTFVMANGKQVTRPVGFAAIEVAGVQTTDEIVFAEEGDLQLLGARTLEGLNLRVDSFARKLVAGGPILAAPAFIAIPVVGSDSQVKIRRKKGSSYNDYRNCICRFTRDGHRAGAEVL